MLQTSVILDLGHQHLFVFSYVRQYNHIVSYFHTILVTAGNNQMVFHRIETELIFIFKIRKQFDYNEERGFNIKGQDREKHISYLTTGSIALVLQPQQQKKNSEFKLLPALFFVTLTFEWRDGANLNISGAKGIGKPCLTLNDIMNKESANILLPIFFYRQQKNIHIPFSISCFFVFFKIVTLIEDYEINL